MLSYEDAMYHKLLLEADVKGELRPVIDRLLAEEEPLSDVALALAYAGDDANKQLSALNEYLSKADEAEIDMETIRNKLMEYFRGRYEKDPDDIGELVGLMSHVGMDSEYAYKNWPHMCICGDYYELSVEGILSPEEFKAYFLSVLYGGEIIDPWDGLKKKAGLIGRIKRIVCGDRRKERNE